jgi:HD-GYP domain-containing protein (c-di-GMP phosphodiesterase class II)
MRHVDGPKITLRAIRNGSSTDLWQMGESSIKFGEVTLGNTQAPPKQAHLPLVRLSYSLNEERETVDWLHQEIQGGARLPIVEADAVVRSLSIAMHAEQAMVLPLLELKEFDQYTTTHSMNVSVLAMALGGVS